MVIYSLHNQSIMDRNLFCFVLERCIEISQTPSCTHCALGTIGKPSMSQGALKWFGSVLDIWCES